MSSERSYSAVRLVEFKPTDNHPLKSNITQVSSKTDNHNGPSSSKNGRQEDKRIVEASTSWGGVDPLSAALKDYDEIQNDLSSPSKGLPPSYIADDFYDDNFHSWSHHKMIILREYKTSERLSIRTSFLNGGDAASGSAISIRNLQSTTLAEKVKHRLEQLDDFEESSVKEMFGLTQQEYVNRIEDLSRALKDSWESDQRVKALKIAIQCAKLLADISVIQFFPSKFVLITDMLDNFGNLVYKRISCKAESKSALESAQETCRNWFYKIASIRELIPRLYVESTILKTLSFITDERQVFAENCKALHRLTSMVRGIGDPLVAVYARAFICRVAMRITPQDKSIFHQNFSDFLLTSKQMESDFVFLCLSSQKVSYSTYLTLYIPALNWILQCLTHKSSESLSVNIVEEYKRFAKERNQIAINMLVLNSLLLTLSPDFIVERAHEFVDLVVESIRRSDESSSIENTFPSDLLLKNLGLAFVATKRGWLGVEKQQKMKYMNDVWKRVSKLKGSAHLSCASVWTDFVVMHLGIKEVNILFKDIIKRIQPDSPQEDPSEKVLHMIKRVTESSSLEDLSTFFALDSFVPLLDLLKKESIKTEACKVIVRTYFGKIIDFEHNLEYQEDVKDVGLITDPVILNSLTYLCKIIHDTVNALTLEDDKREVSDLIISFISRVSFHRDFQSHLEFLVEARSNYSNLEPVIAFLVTCANKISMETNRIVKGQHTKRTMTFVRACLAYSFITIPSLNDAVTKLQLYLSSAQVALLNSCLPQTDAFLQALIEVISTMPIKLELQDGRTRSLEPFLVSYVADLLSFLLIVPVSLKSLL